MTPERLSDQELATLEKSMRRAHRQKRAARRKAINDAAKLGTKLVIVWGRHERHLHRAVEIDGQTVLVCGARTTAISDCNDPDAHYYCEPCSRCEKYDNRQLEGCGAATPLLPTTDQEHP